MTLLIAVEKQTRNVAFINVISNVISINVPVLNVISIVILSKGVISNVIESIVVVPFE
jgi:hypothetical protein